MKAIDIDNQILRSLLGKMMVNDIVSYEMTYEDIVSMDPRCHDGYKIQNRKVRTFDPEEAIIEIEEYLESFTPGRRGGRKLNHQNHIDLIKYLQEYLESGVEDGVI